MRDSRTLCLLRVLCAWFYCALGACIERDLVTMVIPSMRFHILVAATVDLHGFFLSTGVDTRRTPATHRGTVKSQTWTLIAHLHTITT